MWGAAVFALTSTSRWRRPHLYLSERGEEPGSALQIHCAQGVRLPVHLVGPGGGEGRRVHVSGVDVTLLVVPFREGGENKQNICCFFSSSSPAGWDNEKKISILHENFTTVRPEDAFEDVIAKPPIRKVGPGYQGHVGHPGTKLFTFSLSLVRLAGA